MSLFALQCFGSAFIHCVSGHDLLLSAGLDLDPDAFPQPAESLFTTRNERKKNYREANLASYEYKFIPGPYTINDKGEGVGEPPTLLF